MLIRSFVLAAGLLCATGTHAQVTEQDHPAPAPATPHRARIASGVTAGMLLQRVPPVYPMEAQMHHITGTVVLHAIIGRDGRIAKLDVVSGPIALQKAALDAVSQWRYKPFILNGEAVEVETQVLVNFNSGRG